MVAFGDVKTAAGLEKLNAHLENYSYIEGFQFSKADTAIFSQLGNKEPDVKKYVHASRWYRHIAAVSNLSSATTTTNQKEEEDEDCDLFGSSDDEKESEEAARIREERLKAYAEKKSKKPALIAKTSVLLDVKPWADDTDMEALTEAVKKIEMEGLNWGATKLVAVGYGIRKLTIMCTVVDDLVSIEELQEKIEALEEFVQSCDVAAMNKI